MGPPRHPISSVYINDLCSRPRRARPDTVLTPSMNGVYPEQAVVAHAEAAKCKVQADGIPEFDPEDESDDDM